MWATSAWLWEHEQRENVIRAETDVSEAGSDFVNSAQQWKSAFLQMKTSSFQDDRVSQLFVINTQLIHFSKINSVSRGCLWLEASALNDRWLFLYKDNVSHSLPWLELKNFLFPPSPPSLLKGNDSLRPTQPTDLHQMEI